MLKIKNPNDIAGMNFIDGRYKLHRVAEQNDRYRFEFRDTEEQKWVCVDIFRKPKWDDEEKRNMYTVDNGKFTNHWISADYFSKIKNVQWTFNQALKDL
jgi:hypothetical protein